MDTVDRRECGIIIINKIRSRNFLQILKNQGSFNSKTFELDERLNKKKFK